MRAFPKAGPPVPAPQVQANGNTGTVCALRSSKANHIVKGDCLLRNHEERLACTLENLSQSADRRRISVESVVNTKRGQQNYPLP